MITLSWLVVWGNTAANWLALLLLAVILVRQIKDRRVRREDLTVRKVQLQELRGLRQDIRVMRGYSDKDADEVSQKLSDDDPVRDDVPSEMQRTTGRPGRLQDSDIRGS